MKKKLLAIIPIFSIFFFMSCEKDENNIQKEEMYISTIKLNGKLSTEYFYDDYKLVNRINYYDTLGNLSSYSTYEYNESNKLLKTHDFDENGDSTGLYAYEYDNLGSLVKRTFRSQIPLSTFLVTTFFEYNESGQCVKYTNYNSSNVETYNVELDYSKGNRIKEKFYDGISLRATINYTFDNKEGIYQNLSTVYLRTSQHNSTSMTSSDIILNGGVLQTDGRVRLEFEKTTIIFLFSTSVYKYNSQGYPIKLTRTNAMKPSKVDALEYEYIQ